MADYRNDDSYSRSRDEGARYREFDDNDDNRRGGSIFNMGRSRDHDEDRGRYRERDETRDYRRDDRNDEWVYSERGGRSGTVRHRDERGYEGNGRASGRGYGPDDHRGGLPVDETGHLIASNKVEGTAVYGRDGERLGSIYNFMVDKFSGKVDYAVMAYGGFLRMGERYYPLPWRILSYDTRAGGYRIDMTRDDLRTAPSFDRSTEPRFDRSYGSRVNDYYGVRT